MMLESLVTPTQERLLAALFIRSHISNRRRRYASGYLMSELDGVSLSQSEIFVEYRALVERGYITAGTERGELVLKLTSEGDGYCREVIYPELLASLGAGANADDDIGDSATETPNDFADLQGLSIERLAQKLIDDPSIVARLKAALPPEGVLTEAEGDSIRRAIVMVDRSIPDLALSNFEAAQAAAYAKVIMVLVDAPATSKKDIAYYAGLISDLVGISEVVYGSVMAVIAYMYISK